MLPLPRSVAAPALLDRGLAASTCSDPPQYVFDYEAPLSADCVLMYAQRGHGKRSSFYSDYTFGVWREGEDGDELVPVGKAYFGFTDAELKQLDKFVRENTVERFGPVRAVTAGKDGGLVLEIAFEGLQRSPRHKSGIAMRFPRVSRIRWDKPAAQADRIKRCACSSVLGLGLGSGSGLGLGPGLGQGRGRGQG